MLRLIINITPSSKVLFVNLKDNLYLNIVRIINRCKPVWDVKFELPEFGYLGMELFISNSEKVYVYEDKVFYTKDNVLNYLTDSNRRLYIFLMSKIPWDTKREIWKWEETKRISDKMNKNRKKTARNRRLEQALRELEEEGWE